MRRWGRSRRTTRCLRTMATRTGRTRSESISTYFYLCALNNLNHIRLQLHLPPAGSGCSYITYSYLLWSREELMFEDLNISNFYSLLISTTSGSSFSGVFIVKLEGRSSLDCSRYEDDLLFICKLLYGLTWMPRSWFTVISVTFIATGGN